MPFLNLFRGVGVEAYLTVYEVSVLVQLSVQTIRRYTMLKKIPYHKINRTVRYKKSEIELWVEKREAKKAKAQKFQGGLFTETDSEGTT